MATNITPILKPDGNSDWGENALNINWTNQVALNQQLINEIDALVGGGITTFLGLDDSPSTYVGQANKFVTVKGAEDGLEFINITTANVSDVMDKRYVTDTQLVNIGTIPTKVDSVSAGFNISIDNTDPTSPVIYNDSPAKQFSTIAEAQADTTLTLGDVVKIIGFESIDDGGTELRIIESTNTDGTGVLLDSGLYAVKIKDKTMTNLDQKNEKISIKPDTSYISFIFDGVDEYNFTTLLDWLDTQDVKVGFALTVNNIKNLTNAKLDQAYNSSYENVRKAYMSGHELINHGLSGIGVSSELSDKMKQSEIEQSYDMLINAGIPVQNWVSWRSNVDQNNMDFLEKYHATIFCQQKVMDERDIDNGLYDINTVINRRSTDKISNGTQRLTLEDAIDLTGSNVTTQEERLRIAKLHVDKAYETGKNIVFYEHDVSDTGIFDLATLQNLIAYIQAKGIDIITPQEQFQKISNLTKKDIYIEGLRQDVDRLYSSSEDNILEVPDLALWEKYYDNGTATITSALSGSNSVNFIDFVGQTGGVLELTLKQKICLNGDRNITAIPVCFSSFWQREGAGEWIDAIDFYVEYYDGSDIKIDETDKVSFDRIDDIVRRYQETFHPRNIERQTVSYIKICLDFTPELAAPQLKIKNCMLNFGTFPSKNWNYKSKTDYEVDIEMIRDMTGLEVGDSVDFSQITNAKDIKKITVQTAFGTNNDVRGYTVYRNPEDGDTFTVRAKGGTSATFTLSVSNSGISIDSVSIDIGYVVSRITITVLQ